MSGSFPQAPTRRVNPVWIMPIGLMIPLESLTTKIENMIWYMQKPSFPEPTRKIKISSDKEIWLYDIAERLAFGEDLTNETNLQWWIKFTANIQEVAKHHKKIVFFGKKEGYFSINIGRFNREKGLAYFDNPEELLNPLLLESDEKIEERMWIEAEKNFNSYLESAREELEKQRRLKKEEVEECLKRYLDSTRQLEILEAAVFTGAIKSLRSEISKIKLLPGVRIVEMAGKEIRVLLQPIVTAYENVNYFIGEFEILINFDTLPRMSNLSFSIGGYQHPHISNTNVCYGSFGQVMPELLKKRELVEIVRFCQAFLQKYNESSPYKTIDLFPIWKTDEQKIISPNTVLWKKKYPKWGIE